jgi:hypothetical protein
MSATPEDFRRLVVVRRMTALRFASAGWRRRPSEGGPFRRRDLRLTRQKLCDRASVAVGRLYTP